MTIPDLYAIRAERYVIFLIVLYFNPFADIVSPLSFATRKTMDN